jgi:hypothetical protein
MSFPLSPVAYATGERGNDMIKNFKKISNLNLLFIT